MSWARLDDGDANGEPCWIRTSDPLLKSAESRQTEYHTLLNLLGFSSHFSPQSNTEQRPFGASSRTKGGQSAIGTTMARVNMIFLSQILIGIQKRRGRRYFIINIVRISFNGVKRTVAFF